MGPTMPQIAATVRANDNMLELHEETQDGPIARGDTFRTTWTLSDYGRGLHISSTEWIALEEATDANDVRHMTFRSGTTAAVTAPEDLTAHWLWPKASRLFKAAQDCIDPRVRSKHEARLGFTDANGDRRTVTLVADNVNGTLAIAVDGETRATCAYEHVTNALDVATAVAEGALDIETDTLDRVTAIECETVRVAIEDEDRNACFYSPYRDEPSESSLLENDAEDNEAHVDIVGANKTLSTCAVTLVANDATKTLAMRIDGTIRATCPYERLERVLDAVTLASEDALEIETDAHGRIDAIRCGTVRMSMKHEDGRACRHETSETLL